MFTPQQYLVTTLVALSFLVILIILIYHRQATVLRREIVKVNQKILKQRANIGEKALRCFDEVFSVRKYLGFDVTDQVSMVDGILNIIEDRLAPIPDTAFYYADLNDGTRVIFFRPLRKTPAAWEVIWRTRDSLNANIEVHRSSDLLPRDMSDETFEETKDERNLGAVVMVLSQKLHQAMGRPPQRSQEAQ